MTQNIINMKIVLISFVLLTVDGFFSLAAAPSPPGPITPTSLVITFTSLEMRENLNRPYKTFSDISGSIDVIRQTGQSDSAFGIAIAEVATYQAIRLTLMATGQYTGTDPCTGEPVTDAEIGLPESADGQVVIEYQVPHTILGLPKGANPMQPFTVTGAAVELRLVFFAFNSVVCSSDAQPLRTLIGESTGLDTPFAIYVGNDEIGVANSGNDKVLIYSRAEIIANTDPANLANVAPIHTIFGTNTELSAPCGLYIDAVNDEIGVANSDNDKVLIYSRAEIIANTDPDNLANVAPIHILTGNLTELSAPGEMYVDTVNGEIGVVNNGNDSVTIYRRSEIITMTDPGTKIANVEPRGTIRGDKTGLNLPVGIALHLDTDPTNDEIIVANAGNDTVLIYGRTVSGNVSPFRRIRGSLTGLGKPVGIYLDTVNDEIGVTNLANDSLTVHKRDDKTVQLERLPVLINSADQQVLFPQYFYTGVIDRETGSGDASLLDFDGYNFVWKITDDRFRQEGDASDAVLIPPSKVIFELTDGQIFGSLAMDCPQLTPFIILELSTNCPPSPLIRSPVPAVSGDYTIPAVLLQTITINTLPLTSSPLPESEFPRPVPTLTLSSNKVIEKIDWVYVNEAGDELTSPLIFSQQFRITLTGPLKGISACYELVVGGASPAPVVFVSGPLSSEVRSLSKIKNNRCDISLDTVATITFTMSNALGENFISTWVPG